MVSIFLPKEARFKIETLIDGSFHIMYDCSDEEAEKFSDSLTASIIEKSAQ